MKELADLLRLLRHGDVRLVTIIGPPEIGKSRLAEEVAAELPERADAITTAYEPRGQMGSTSTRCARWPSLRPSRSTAS